MDGLLLETACNYTSSIRSVTVVLGVAARDIWSSWGPPPHCWPNYGIPFQCDRCKLPWFHHYKCLSCFTQCLVLLQCYWSDGG